MNLYARRFLSERERLESQTERLPWSGCWVWMGAIDSGGRRLPYGKFWVNSRGRSIVAHRASWAIYHGAIPNGMRVLHRCDVACCVNPEHLFLGTNKDNTQDMIRKGRKYVQRGEASRFNKITEEQARAIKDAHGNQYDIAAQFGVTQSCVSLIKRGKNWKHL